VQYLPNRTAIESDPDLISPHGLGSGISRMWLVWYNISTSKKVIMGGGIEEYLKDVFYEQITQDSNAQADFNTYQATFASSGFSIAKGEVNGFHYYYSNDSNSYTIVLGGYKDNYTISIILDNLHYLQNDSKTVGQIAGQIASNISSTI
jgi:hypothetical protein